VSSPRCRNPGLAWRHTSRAGTDRPRPVPSRRRPLPPRNSRAPEHHPAAQPVGGVAILEVEYRTRSPGRKSRPACRIRRKRSGVYQLDLPSALSRRHRSVSINDRPTTDTPSPRPGREPAPARWRSQPDTTNWHVPVATAARHAASRSSPIVTLPTRLRSPATRSKSSYIAGDFSGTAMTGTARDRPPVLALPACQPQDGPGRVARRASPADLLSRDRAAALGWRRKAATGRPPRRPRAGPPPIDPSDGRPATVSVRPSILWLKLAGAVV
jgi:hypothetical protein